MPERYYIGLQLPSEISSLIEAAQEELFDPTVAIRPLEPHITLLPPPAVEGIDPKTFISRVKTETSTCLPVRITLGEVITFDRRAIAIDVQSDEVLQLQERLASLLPAQDRLVYYPNPQFTPHITLNQAIRSKALPPGLAEEYKKRLGKILPSTCVIDRLTLFRWVRPREYQAEFI